jgi:hypothetical protein
LLLLLLLCITGGRLYGGRRRACTGETGAGGGCGMDVRTFPQNGRGRASIRVVVSYRSVQLRLEVAKSAFLLFTIRGLALVLVLRHDHVIHDFDFELLFLANVLDLLLDLLTLLLLPLLGCIIRAHALLLFPLLGLLVVQKLLYLHELHLLALLLEHCLRVVHVQLLSREALPRCGRHCRLQFRRLHTLPLLQLRLLVLLRLDLSLSLSLSLGLRLDLRL